ncbi:MAG: SDR family oxidoreductase [Terriglobia bacterium]|jgi:putative NADH-flavin reductase
MRLLLLWIFYATALSVGLSGRGFRSAASDANAGAEGSPNRVLIVGATGGTGRHLIAQALERGHVVTALARDPSALRIEHPRLRVMQGDVLDYPSVEAAVRGQDVVISALGHKRFFQPTHILSEGTRNLLQALETRGVPRFVCETALGIGDSAGRMGVYYTFFVIPFILPFYFWDKARQERVIAANRLNWVMVRPGALTNGAKRGRYRHGPNVGSFLSTVRISRADVADFMLNQMTDNTYLRSAPGVCW